MAAVPLPGAPVVFRGVSCSWLPFSGSAPIWLWLAGLLLQWTFIVELAVSWYTTWFSTLCQFSFFRCLLLAGSAPFWLQFVGLLLWWSLVVGLEVSLMRRLVFYHVPCSSSGACRLHSLPCSRFLWGFSGHRVSVLLLPWCRRLGISPSLLFLCFSCSGWLAGVRWVLHPVSGCSSWGGVLGFL